MVSRIPIALLHLKPRFTHEKKPQRAALWDWLTMVKAASGSLGSVTGPSLCPMNPLVLEMACVTQLYKVLFGIGAFDACVRDVF